MSMRARRDPRVMLFGYYGVCGALAVFFLFPIVWVALSSLKPSVEAMQAPPTWWPSRFSIENYRNLLTGPADLTRPAANSLSVAVASALGVAILSAAAGYGLSRHAFIGRRVALIAMLSTLMIPFQTIAIPLFMVMRQLGLQNSLTGLALVYTALHLPLAIFIMQTAFDSVPRELDEAAIMDGASGPTILARVLAPLVAPSVVTVLLINFIACWNEFFAALILMTDQRNYTLPVVLINVQFGYMGVVDWGALQAGTMLTMLPCLLLALAFQRYYVAGLTAGAAKG
ncbi:MAG: carbohydrate ABC transporter permease [Methylobacteriaceae bacterium]|nr:carbohydrate ABC transporter permease [Methylobacteriaceae bacterium]